MRLSGSGRIPLALWLVMIGTAYGAVALGSSFVWSDIATLFGGVANPFSICFGVLTSEDVPTNPMMPQWVQMRSTREEDLSQDYQAYFRTQWTQSGTAAQGSIYCAPGQFLPRQGHYSYELRLCPTLPADPSMIGSCSPWISSKDPTVANINGSPRAWWIYGYMDPQPPTNVSVSQ